ncbi:SRPBCC domain-containing protein [Demequina rhizosphaerae]|uniref:SRPBCC domain-containing protein n=1 Tax=Demequina rhizosphaerae TaxID=1638985 RepID=UPI000782D204|nr:SRPBCC domain-containing protein [Demequina rhizosphaerae]
MDISFEAPAEPPVLVSTTRLAFPLPRVWTAVTEPLYVQQWWAPHGYVNRSVDMDVEPGGAWRVVQSDPEGNTFSFYGRYDKVEPQSQLTYTFVSELFPDVLTWMRIDMGETPAGTMLVTSHMFPDDYHRTGYLNLGGVARMRESAERLEALLRSMS